MELRPTPLTAGSTAKAPAITVLGVVLGATVAVVVGAAVMLARGGSSVSAGGELEREVAVKLEAAGLTELAAQSWQRWLDSGSGSAQERAAVAGRLGVALVDRGRWEQGLALLYQAEALDEAALGPEHGAKVVHALEALGRTQAAKSTLSQRTRLETGPAPAQPAGDTSDPVVATIDGEAIHRSRIDDAMAELPPSAAALFDGPEGRAQLLQQVVGEELLWRRARRLEVHNDPTVRRRLELAHRRLVVSTWLEREALAQEPTTSDLETFWAANRDRYRPSEGAEPMPLEQIRPVVEQDWKRQRLEGAWRDAVDRELAGGSVTLHPERLAGGADAP